MTKKEITDLTYATLNCCLAKYGYKYIKSESCFMLIKNDNTYYIRFNSVDRKPEYKISFVFQIRNRKVEDIANKFTNANPNYFKYSATIMIPFTYFVQRRLEFHVVNEEDFTQIEKFFLPFYTQTIDPFIRKHSTLVELSSLVDHLIQESNKFYPITINLFRRNIILLQLTNDPKFEQRTEQIRTIIQPYPEIEKHYFEETYQYLKTI